MIDLHATSDAMVWATEWCRIARELQERDQEIIDEGWMVGWFANAIMQGHDEARRRYEMVNAHDALMRGIFS